MRSYVERKRMEVSSVTCDCCKQEFSFSGDDEFKAQEFLFIEYRGGYASVFGDGADIRCDLCDECVNILLGKYIRVD